MTTTTEMTHFRPFNTQDFNAFAGVSTGNPRIAFHKELAIVIDGQEIHVITEEPEYRIKLPTATIATVTAEALVEDLKKGERGTQNLLILYGFRGI